jgi:hypothetical protein
MSNTLSATADSLFGILFAKSAVTDVMSGCYSRNPQPRTSCRDVIHGIRSHGRHVRDVQHAVHNCGQSPVIHHL